nr:immunoglobulin light chain junction region [Macaca mulatta]MOX84528.1 immunoglobulin light chain junction region [Macaca mulatta]MOX84600.1 immunoglobulin light chain junction region [Macaca mulatta]MOX84627.1 immunoglobulin light chain junction region [Macaca mulatta]MOX84685.1 immunoglobulin light chain junction region [Macaca mulatta]
CMESLEFPWTF